MVIEEEESNLAGGDTSRHSSPREKLDVPKDNQPYKNMNTLGSDIRKLNSANTLELPSAMALMSKNTIKPRATAAISKDDSSGLELQTRTLTLSEKKISDDKRITLFKPQIPINIEKVPELEASQSSSSSSLDDDEDACELVAPENVKEQNFSCQIAHFSAER